jgi:hypothetical protein
MMLKEYSDESWKTLLCDGLHLSDPGHNFVFSAICDKISSSLPDLLPCNLSFDAPTWFQLLKGQPNANMEETWRESDPRIQLVPRKR